LAVVERFILILDCLNYRSCSVRGEKRADGGWVGSLSALLWHCQLWEETWL